VIGYALAHENHYHPLWGAIGAVLAGGVGIGAGALVGSRQTERWEPLRLPIRIGILPSTDTIGLSVELTNR